MDEGAGAAKREFAPAVASVDNSEIRRGIL